MIFGEGVRSEATSAREWIPWLRATVSLNEKNFVSGRKRVPPPKWRAELSRGRI